MSDVITLETVNFNEIEMAAAIECHVGPCAIFTGATKADNLEVYMFLDEPDVRTAAKKLEDGTLEVNFKKYMENVWVLQQRLEQSYSAEVPES